MSTLAANNITDAAGGNTATINGMTPTADSLQGFRNRIINGGMGIWQRGTSFSAGGYAQDRWLLYAPSGSFSSTRSTDVPSGFQFSAELSGTNPSLTQRIEVVNCFDLVGGSVTVSFWAKSTSGTQGLFAILQNPSASDNWTSITDFATTTVSASPSSDWTYYTATFNNLPAGVANGLGLAIGRSAGGSTTTRITGVQLEAGSVATPFERRPYGTELQLAQRYFQQVRSSTAHIDGLGTGVWRSTSYLPVVMRATPTLSLVGSPNYLCAASTNRNLATIGSNYSIGAIVQFDGTFNSSVSSLNGFPATLSTDTAGYTTYIAASAEL